MLLCYSQFWPYKIYGSTISNSHGCYYVAKVEKRANINILTKNIIYLLLFTRSKETIYNYYVYCSRCYFNLTNCSPRKYIDRSTISKSYLMVPIVLAKWKKREYE